MLYENEILQNIAERVLYQKHGIPFLDIIPIERESFDCRQDTWGPKVNLLSR